MLNPRVRQAEYAVRGPVVARAQEIEKDLKTGKKKYPFEKVIYCNIGNPQALGQQPVTYLRQVLAACICPTEAVLSALPSDVVRRAKKYLASIPGGSVGAYTETAGLGAVRAEVADYITRRDGTDTACDSKHVILTNGASDGIRRVIQLLLDDAPGNEALMIPCPQYPLYSCQIVLSGGQIVYYATDECAQWSVSREELEKQYRRATEAQHLLIKAIVVINPGNPTGAVLSVENMRTIIQFAADFNLSILADEVYQDNVYDGGSFVSFRRVLLETKHKVPLYSFHSLSKGLLGECGLRGGYVETVNVPDEVFAQLLKLSASQLSSNTLGQIACGVMCNPPKPDDESHDLYKRETRGIFLGLERRAKLLTDKLRAIPGYSFPTPIQGAMYAFPSIALSARTVERAKQAHMEPDEFYCMQLLEQTGIVCVPGSGFGLGGHFRTTILPPEEDIQHLVDALAGFHQHFDSEL